MNVLEISGLKKSFGGHPVLRGLDLAVPEHSVFGLIGQNAVSYTHLSFEWMILKSGLLEDRDLKKILDEPYDYIESAENFSWERFFTKLLIARSADSYLKYSKNHLNPVYIKENIEIGRAHV